jgi:DNA-binding transcriptional MerR regulator
MLTISQIAKKFNLSRGALLYYESIGLFASSETGDNNYRLFTERDEETLRRICVFRDMRIPLPDIKKLLRAGDSETVGILEARLARARAEISALRRLQRDIVRMLQSKNARKSGAHPGKKEWVEMLKAAGLTGDGMAKWHREFEKNAPDAHQEFLEALGLPEPEIKMIREKSRGG